MRRIWMPGLICVLLGCGGAGDQGAKPAPGTSQEDDLVITPFAKPACTQGMINKGLVSCGAHATAGKCSRDKTHCDATACDAGYDLLDGVCVASGTGECKTVNALLWCRAPDAASQTCSAVCSAVGKTVVTDNAAWFEAQNTIEECTAIATAFGLPPVYTPLDTSTYACVEYTTTGTDDNTLCSILPGCPANHVNGSDGFGLKSVCPCQ